ncbi:AraC family transcriptional regulator [Stappia indica]|uniref:AraC family transcriptional regulator n=1 Tax=Stappia indica TaxID=538381 RepID=UPI001CD1F6BF|nr:AraC family transcriptional regulator [Stappia indica]MCA1298944.1 AraC family transcriptional regulator [Stappia indica]
MHGITQSTATDGTALGERDRAHFWRAPGFDNLECLAATFVTHAFTPHTHETYVVGAMEAGLQAHAIRGTRAHCGPGDLYMLNPDVLHDGAPCDNGYRYRMTYPSVRLLQSIQQDLTGRADGGTPTFRTPSAHDPLMARALIAAHRAMQAEGHALESDERMYTVLAQLLIRYAELPGPSTGTREPGPIGQVREYLAAHYAENVDLETLARVASLSRAHLIRSFKRSCGQTPHAFLTDLRVRAARRALETGARPLDVALACGFADQSHLTRAFKARTGVTPAVYRGLRPTAHS